MNFFIFLFGLVYRQTRQLVCEGGRTRGVYRGGRETTVCELSSICILMPVFINVCVFIHPSFEKESITELKMGKKWIT